MAQQRQVRSATAYSSGYNYIAAAMAKQGASHIAEKDEAARAVKAAAQHCAKTMLGPSAADILVRFDGWPPCHCHAPPPLAWRITHDIYRGA